MTSEGSGQVQPSAQGRKHASATRLGVTAAIQTQPSVCRRWAAGAADLPEDAESWLAPQVEHLRTEYPRPLGHLRIARRWCVVGAALVILLVAIGRFRLGLL